MHTILQNHRMDQTRGRIRDLEEASNANQTAYNLQPEQILLERAREQVRELEEQCAASQNAYKSQCEKTDQDLIVQRMALLRLEIVPETQASIDYRIETIMDLVHLTPTEDGASELLKEFSFCWSCVLATKICNFMELTNLDWVSRDQVPFFRPFMIQSWGNFDIPTLNEYGILDMNEAWGFLLELTSAFAKRCILFQQHDILMPMDTRNDQVVQFPPGVLPLQPGGPMHPTANDTGTLWHLGEKDYEYVENIRRTVGATSQKRASARITATKSYGGRWIARLAEEEGLQKIHRGDIRLKNNIRFAKFNIVHLQRRLLREKDALKILQVNPETAESVDSRLGVILGLLRGEGQMTNNRDQDLMNTRFSSTWSYYLAIDIWDFMQVTGLLLHDKYKKYFRTFLINSWVGFQVCPNTLVEAWAYIIKMSQVFRRKCYEAESNNIPLPQAKPLECVIPEIQSRLYAIDSSCDSDLIACGICLDNSRDTRLTNCGHSLCLSCLEKNLFSNRAPKCPFCKAALVPQAFRVHKNVALQEDYLDSRSHDLIWGTIPDCAYDQIPRPPGWALAL